MNSLIRFSAVITMLALFASNGGAQLTGGSTYPINGTENPPTSFATMQSAVAYLNNNGVTGSGDVILEFTTGYTNETDTIWIRQITGTGTGTRIVFRPAAGFTVNMSLTPPNTTHPYVIRINGSHIVLDGRAGGTGTSRDWTITATGSGTTGTGRSAVQLTNTGTGNNVSNVTLRYLSMIGQAANTTNAVLHVTGTSTNTMSDILIEENLVRSSATSSTDTRGWGIEVVTISNLGNTNFVIRNNEITQFYARGISWTGAAPAAKIYGNRIYHSAPVTQPTTAEFAGLYYSSSSTNGAGTEIYNNMVYGIQLTNGTTSVNGIYVFNSPTSGTPIRVYNNMVSIGDGLTGTAEPLAVHGIRENTTSTGLLDVYFNSVYVGGSPTSGANASAAFRKQLSNNMNIHNNVFFNARSNNGATATHWGIMVNNTSFSSIGNNDYFANGSGGVLGTTDGTTTGNRTTISAWTAAVPSDVGSVSQNPNYVNPTATPPDLKINTAIPTQLESGGTPIAGITTDFEGDTRNVTTPDIGADEFAGTPIDLTPPLIVYTPLGQTHLTSDRLLTATITDPSGIASSPNGPRLYYKKSTSGTYLFDNAPSVSGDDYTFTISASALGGLAPEDTIQYYVAAQDGNANAGTNPAGGSGSNPPGTTPPANPNSYKILASISGSYTIGTGGTFATVKQAFDFVNANVVTGPATFSVISDVTETASAVLNPVTYAGGPHTITIMPTGAPRTISGNFASAVIDLSGADNVVIDGRIGGVGSNKELTIENPNTGSGTAFALRMINGASNNTLQYVVFKGSGISTTTGGVIRISTSTTTFGGNSNNLIQNCDLTASTTRPAAGLIISGTTTVPNENNVVMGCNIYDWTSNGVYIGNEALNTVIDGNNIYQTPGSSATTVQGMQWVRGTGDVRNNRIYNLQSSAAAPTIRGFYYSGSSGIDMNMRFYNNFVSLDAAVSNPGATIYGIDYFGFDANSFEVYYNSVYVGGSGVTGGSSYAIAKRDGAVTYKARNNVAYNARSNSTGAGTHYGMYYSDTTGTTIEASHNDYFATGAGSMLGRWGTTDAATITELQTLSGREGNSISADPNFLDAANNNLHINPSVPPSLDSAGTPVAGITTDIDGDVRNSVTPDIGADEFAYAPPANDLRIQTVLLPPSQVRTGDAVQFRALVENLSVTATEPSYTVNWLVDTTPQTPVVGGPIAPGVTDTVVLPWTAVFGQHLITAIVAIPIDGDHSNDTGRVSIGVYGTVFETGADSLTATVNTSERDSVSFYVRNIETQSADFVAHAVRYTQSPGPESLPHPVVFPMTVSPAGSASSPMVETVVVPSAYANTAGGSTFLGPLASTARTHVQLIHQSELASVVGQFLGGITWRLAPAAGSPWPSADATITNFDVYLGESVTPSAVSNTVADNYVGPRTQVRAGALTIAAGSFPSGGNPNAFGVSIEFDTPWKYNGGHLIIELRHTGFSSSTSVDAAGTATPGYGTLYVNRWASGYDVTTASSQGNFSVTQLALSSGAWLTVNPTSGTIAPLDSVLMKAHFDASDPGIVPGTYYGHVEMAAANTGLADTLRVPARLSVQLSPNPKLFVSPDSLNFGRVAVGGSRTLSVVVRNNGGATLSVTGITQSDTNFSATPTSFSLAYGDTQRVFVTFTGPMPGETVYNGLMTFVSNAVPGGQQVKLVGETIGLPLSGDFTVGLTLFNSLMGKDLRVETRTRVTQQEIVEEVEVEEQAERVREHAVQKNPASISNVGVDIPEPEIPRRTILVTRVVEVKETYGVLMDGDVPYEGPLRAELGAESGPRAVYPTITAAVADVTERGVSGPVRFLLVDATYPGETYPINLGPVTGMSSTNTITIKPQTSVSPVIEGTAANMFQILGGSNFIFDGSNTTGGTTRDMTIRNTSTTGVLLRLQDGATNNTVRNTVLEGAVTSTTSGIVVIGTAASAPEGNSNNTFTNNFFTNAAGASYSNAIYSSGTTANPNSNMTVTGNHFVNFTGTGVRGTTGTGGGWSVETNHFYNNAATAPSTTQAGININPGVISGGNIFSGNFIGGSAPNAGGSPWVNSGAVTVSGIIAGVDTINQTAIQNNVIRNFSLTSTGAAAFNGISVTTGRPIISNNTIGEDSTPNSIVNAGSSTTHGIQVTATSASQPTTVANNLVANLSATGTGTSVRVRGIHFTGGAQFNIQNNIIHSLATNGSQVGLTANNQVAVGINLWPGGVFYQGDVTGNTIYDIAANNTGALATMAAGMMITNHSGTLSGNRIFDIRNMSTGTTPTAPPIAAGLYIRFTDASAFFNNMISIGSDQSSNVQFNGAFSVIGSEGNDLAFVYNSVSVSGTVASGGLSSHAYMRGDNTGFTPNVTVRLRNNILSNTRSGGTGKHYAIANQGTVANDTGWSTRGSVSVPLATGWNMISNPILTPNDSVRQLFPTSDFDYAFAFVPGVGYSQRYQMENGAGYWGKFTSGGTANISGNIIARDTINVVQGWNMVGSVSAAFDTADVIDPAGIRATSWFAFNGGYAPSQTIDAGAGYWVKANANGQFIFSARAAALPSNVNLLHTSNPATVGLWGSADQTFESWQAVSGCDIHSVTGNPMFVSPTDLHITNPASPASNAGIPIAGITVDYDGQTRNATTPDIGADEFAPFTAAKVVASAEDPLDRLNALVIAGEAGGSQTLYFGTDANGEIPVSMFDLPPAPPEGAFDARFASEEGGTMVKVHQASGEFPITIQGTGPITVSWSVAAGDPIYEITDGLGGSVFPSTQLSGEGSLRITNPAVRRLVLRVGGAEIPTEFALYQNYPNPFNPVTNIRFALPVAGRVDVEVFNILGQRVSVLAAREMSAGYHVVQWDGTSDAGQPMGSGVYFVRLRADRAIGGFTDVRKIMLLK